MKLFTVGPVQTYPDVRDVYQYDIPYFRTTEFGDLVKNNLRRLAGLLGTEYKDNILYFTASGTGAMEATVQNCFSPSDKVLIINGGSFGHRFCELFAWHNIPYDSIDLEWNQALTAEHLAKFDNAGYTALIVNLHETSTGQLYNIDVLRDFCDRNNMYLVVDAISTFLADDFAMDKNHIDITIFSSQKGLCLSAGLSFVACSQRMIEKIKQNPKPASYYFNFADHFNNINRGQTPFTPAVCIMYELDRMLTLIERVGKDQWLRTIADKCHYFREKALKCGLAIPNTYPLSNMLTPVRFDGVSAYDVFLELQNKYRIFVNPCGGDLGTKMFRVSHIGNTSIADIDDLLEKMQICVNELKQKDNK